jgi:CheY-like chemotaxis protein
MESLAVVTSGAQEPSATVGPDILKVLLVEDSDDNRFVMKRLLEAIGYVVLEAVNGDQAVKIAQDELPDLILMDLSLPRVDGLTATRRIRASPELAGVPIVALSAYDPATFQAKALAAGCNEYLTKPFDFGKLEVLLRDLLRARGAARKRDSLSVSSAPPEHSLATSV